MGARKIQVVGDSNLVLSQVQGSFAVKEITLALYRIMAKKLMESFKHVVLEHIPSTTNRYANALATFHSKLTFVKKQANVVVIRREASSTDAPFLKEAPEGDDWKETVRRELSKLSEAFSIKCLKEYINVTWTLYKRLPEGVLT
ncbi:uncharacterized protein [Pyrus communis]|uniref:uncharacterized protein n=1 Tax=Pyrus communis TaxID=23211 RepID=UPI0035BF1357